MANLYELLQVYGREGDLEIFETLQQGGVTLRLIKKALEADRPGADADDFGFYDAGLDDEF